jgi:hypothetical protein
MISFLFFCIQLKLLTKLEDKMKVIKIKRKVFLFKKISIEDKENDSFLFQLQDINECTTKYMEGKLPNNIVQLAYFCHSPKQQYIL